MTQLSLRPREECRYDLVALGEVMLRFDPGDGRIATTRTFPARRVGANTTSPADCVAASVCGPAIVTALADNPIGRLIEDLILQGGVEQAQLAWRAYDGIGREVRNGLNFTERGFGVRGAVGCSDRGHSAASQLQPGEVDWDGSSAATVPAGSTPAASSRPLRELRRARARGRRGRAPPRHDRVVRPQLPAVACGSRAVANPQRLPSIASSSRTSTSSSGTRRTSQLALATRSTVDEDLLELDVAALRAAVRARARRPPATVVCRLYAPPGAYGKHQRLERQSA